MEIDLSRYRSISNYFDFEELSAYLHEPLFITPDTGITARVITHWDHEGLIENRREEGQRWRRLSLIEFIWFRIIDELRKAGTKIPTLRLVREYLLNPIPLNLPEKIETASKEVEEWEAWTGSLTDMQRLWVLDQLEVSLEKHLALRSEISVLEFLLMEVIVKGTLVSIAVFPGGEVIPLTENPEQDLFPSQLKKLCYETYSRVSLNGILHRFLADEKKGAQATRLGFFTSQEKELLEAVRSGEYDSIEVLFRDKEMNKLLLKKNLDTNRRSVDILAEANYQDIRLKKHNGRITKIENTIKRNFKK